MLYAMLWYAMIWYDEWKSMTLYDMVYDYNAMVDDFNAMLWNLNAMLSYAVCFKRYDWTKMRDKLHANIF